MLSFSSSFSNIFILQLLMSSFSPSNNNGNRTTHQITSTRISPLQSINHNSRLIPLTHSTSFTTNHSLQTHLYSFSHYLFYSTHLPTLYSNNTLLFQHHTQSYSLSQTQLTLLDTTSNNFILLLNALPYTQPS